MVWAGTSLLGHALNSARQSTRPSQPTTGRDGGRSEHDQCQMSELILAAVIRFRDARRSNRQPAPRRL